jgi:hypothetical protein
MRSIRLQKIIFTQFYLAYALSALAITLSRVLQVVGVRTFSGISAALGFAIVACVIAVACAQANDFVPDVPSISAAGVPLVPDVLTVAGFPDVVVFSAVAFIPAVAGISAVAAVPAIDEVFAVASFLPLPGVSMLLLLVSLHTVLYNDIYRPQDYQAKAIGLSFFLLSNYRTIEYRTGGFEKLSDYRLSDQKSHNLKDSQKTIGCQPLPLTRS